MIAAPFALRKWQQDALPIALDALTAEDERRGVISAVMGAGKSILIRAIVGEWLADPERASLGPVVVTTPTVKLVEQLGETLAEGLDDVGLFYTHRKQPGARVVVCCNASAASLAAAWGPDRRAGLWIADEAHRSESGGLLEAAEAFQPHRRLAVTATPFRSDERERISMFDEVLYSYTPADALRDRVIVPWRIYGWEEGDATIDEACVAMIRAQAVGPGIVNASSIEDAEGFAGILTRAGISAQAIHSRLPRQEQSARLARLRAGDLAALVHVSLLTEGIDLPWLRWMCLRRPVGARVRFVQEVGRVLRADRNDPSKTEAILLDPHDLFGVFGLSYEAALGWYEEQLGEAQERDEQAGDEDDEGREQRRAVSRGAVAAWARQLLLALQAEGIALQSRVQGASWRTLPPTEKQLATVRRNAWVKRYLPTAHADILGAVAKQPDGLSRGVVSDLLSIEFALRDRDASWEPEVEVPVPSAAQVSSATAELPVDRVRRCGSALMMGYAAIVILEGNRVEYAGVRRARPGDSTWSLNASALRLAGDDGVNPVRSDDPEARSLAHAEIRKQLWGRA